MEPEVEAALWLRRHLPWTIYEIVHEADEGTAAHLWQILMGGQVPIVLYFAARWLPRAPRDALEVLALQVAMAVSACLPVYFFT